jgi:hypothetical protein
VLTDEGSAVPLYIPKMRPRSFILRQVDTGQLALKERAQLARHSVVRDQQPVVVGEGYKVAVEEPMNCRRKSEAVLNDVWAIL